MTSTGTVSTKSFYGKTLDAANDSLLPHHRVGRPSHGTTPTEIALERATLRMLANRQPFVLCIDEAHHLGIHSTPQQREKNLDAIKTFANSAAVPILMMGSYELVEFGYLSGCRRRSTRSRGRLPSLRHRASSRCARVPRSPPLLRAAVAHNELRPHVLSDLLPREDGWLRRPAEDLARAGVFQGAVRRSRCGCRGRHRGGGACARNSSRQARASSVLEYASVGLDDNELSACWYLTRLIPFDLNPQRRIRDHTQEI